MKIGKKWVYPPTSTPLAGTIRQPTGASHMTGLAVPSCHPFKVMMWNIATLGGGIGYPQQRDQTVIDVIAKVIAHVQPDVCLIVEVMRYARPPIEPKFYEPREGVTIKLEGRIKNKIKTISQLVRNDFLNNKEMKVKKHAKFLFERDNPYDHSEFKVLDGLMEGNVKNDAIKILLDVEIYKIYIRVLERHLKPIIISQFGDKFTKKSIGEAKLPIKISEHIDTDETVEDLVQDFGVNEWWQLPGKPYTIGMDDDDAEREIKRYRIAEACMSMFRKWVEKLYAKGVPADVRDDSENKATKVINAESLVNNWMERLQDKPEEKQRKLEAYEVIRKAWDKANKNSKHPGASEIGRIMGKLTDYKSWPSTDAPNKVDADNSNLTINGNKLNDMIVYTENETYCVIYKKNRVKLKSVTRLSGYKKRAPFVFQVDFMPSGKSREVNLIAWHAPSDSNMNKDARTKNFKIFSESFSNTAWGNPPTPTLSIGDFNINTESLNIISNFDSNDSATDFFASVSGHPKFPEASFFWKALTTLKKNPDMDDSTPKGIQAGGHTYVTRASAFDKILPFWPSCTSWSVYYEMIVPVHIMLADNKQIGKITMPTFENAGNFPIKIDGVAGVASALHGHGPPDPGGGSDEFKMLAGLIARARLISDHLPILSVFKVLI